MKTVPQESTESGHCKCQENNTKIKKNKGTNTTAVLRIKSSAKAEIIITFVSEVII